eukprot:1042560-Ditylum_brightwellii.AAC.1
MQPMFYLFIAVLLVYQHQTIVYKRINPVSSYVNYKSLFLDNWKNVNNVLNTDFELYSSVNNALSGTNKWTYCNYNNSGVGFPHDCGPSDHIGNQWSCESVVALC